MIQKRADDLTNSVHAYPARGLVVEDSRAVRTMVCRFLNARQIFTREACDGLIAWELVQRSRFDVIITDVEMPHWTGIDLVAAMRRSSDDWIRNTPVIVTSTVSTPEVCEAAREFYSTYFMPKPLVAGQLDVMLQLVATMQRDRQNRWSTTPINGVI